LYILLGFNNMTVGEGLMAIAGQPWVIFCPLHEPFTAKEQGWIIFTFWEFITGQSKKQVAKKGKQFEIRVCASPGIIVSVCLQSAKVLHVCEVDFQL
jgi:hypothetical protein